MHKYIDIKINNLRNCNRHLEMSNEAGKFETKNRVNFNYLAEQLGN